MAAADHERTPNTSTTPASRAQFTVYVAEDVAAEHAAAADHERTPETSTTPAAEDGDHDSTQKSAAWQHHKPLASTRMHLWMPECAGIYRGRWAQKNDISLQGLWARNIAVRRAFSAVGSMQGPAPAVCDAPGLTIEPLFVAGGGHRCRRYSIHQRIRRSMGRRSRQHPTKSSVAAPQPTRRHTAEHTFRMT